MNPLLSWLSRLHYSIQLDLAVAFNSEQLHVGYPSENSFRMSRANQGFHYSKSVTEQDPFHHHVMEVNDTCL